MSRLNYQPKTPPNELLKELSKALGQARHPHVASFFVLGLLWSYSPDWFTLTTNEFMDMRDKEDGR